MDSPDVKPQVSADGHRGREASRARTHPARRLWSVLASIGGNLGRHNISLICAGLAMYALLAVFPALSATVFVYGLFGYSHRLITELHAFSGLLPPGAWELFRTQLQAAAARQQSAQTAAAAASLLVAIWSARSGMSSLISAVDIAYGEGQRRSFIVQLALSLLFTACALLAFVLMLVLAIALPVALRFLGISDWMRGAATVIRWLLLWCFAGFALASVYRFAPRTRQAPWRWLSAGSVTAATLWVAGTVAFGFYIGSSSDYRHRYGAFSSVVVLLMWFLLSSFTAVLGAEVDAELERRARPRALQAR